MFAYLNMGGMKYANKISLSKTLAESYARQEGRDEGREEAAKLLIEDAVQNQRDLDSLLTSLKAIFKDQAHIDELLAKYYYR